MDTPARTRDRLLAQRGVPLLRLDSLASTVRALDCLREAGFLDSTVSAA